MTKRSGTLTAALESAPCSLRALAREAGISHVHLLRIRRGLMVPTSATAEKLAVALATWGTRCTAAARAIRTANQPKGRG